MDSDNKCMTNASKGAIKKRRRDFQVSWLDESSFKGWLTPHPTESKTLCMACNRTISYLKTNLMQHSQTVKHIENVNSSNHKAIDNNNNDTLSHQDRVKRAEIKLAAFFAEHNVAFCTVDHLVPLLKDICMNPEIVHLLEKSVHILLKM